MLHDAIKAPPLGEPEVRQIREQITHLEHAIAMLKSALPNQERGNRSAAVSGSGHEVSEKTIRRLLRARRLREERLGADLFSDPAWDILLETFMAELGQRRLSVSSVCLASSVPPTTALRWAQKLERDGWLTRHADPLDGRRFFLELSPDASSKLRSYFEELESLPV